MNSDKQYFDRLQEKYSEKYGHELYAIDDIEGKKIFIDINDPWSVSSSWGALENEIRLIKMGLFPLTLRQKFERKETFEKKADELAKLINVVHTKENSILCPTSRYNRNKEK